MNVHSSFICNSQKKNLEATQMPVIKWMDQQIMVVLKQWNASH